MVISRAARQPLDQLGRNTSAGRLWVPGIQEGREPGAEARRLSEKASSMARERQSWTLISCERT